MRISKISLILAFCLPVFLFSCRKDNGSGKYIVKVTALDDKSVIQDIFYKGKNRGGNGPDEATSTWTFKDDTIEADGHLKIASYVTKENSSKIGLKIEVFKLGSGGKQTKVGSVRKSASKGFKIADGVFGYGATIEFPSNKKEAIKTNEQLVSVRKELFGN